MRVFEDAQGRIPATALLVFAMPLSGCLYEGGAAAEATDTSDTSAVAYRLQGTVRGLADIGLVLAGADSEIAIGTDGTFVFPNALVDASPYEVTVAQQPLDDRTCTVERGKGTVHSADVIDVVVTCSRSTFTVGGRIHGLGAIGLILENDAADAITLSKDGTFVFPKALATGTTYSVTLSQQPEHETCTVSAGAGIVGANDVTDVSVDCSESEFFVRGKVVGLKSSIVLGNTDDAIAGSVDDTARDDAVAVSGDGDFHFMAPVRLGHRYDVTVLEQPSLPQQSCVVEDGRGLVTDGDVFVRIDCTEPTVQP